MLTVLLVVLNFFVDVFRTLYFDKVLPNQMYRNWVSLVYTDNIDHARFIRTYRWYLDL